MFSKFISSFDDFPHMTYITGNRILYHGKDFINGFLTLERKQYLKQKLKQTYSLFKLIH